MTFEELLYRYKSAYYSFPQPLKNFLGEVYGSIPLSIRYGSSFSKYSNILKKFENASEQFKLDYMYNKTLETIIFAEKNIPYYKEIFQEYGVSSANFKSLDDIRLFPSISKKDIKTKIDIMHTDIVEKPVAYYSGGSMSTPTKFYLQSSSRAKEKAYVNYIFSQIGYTYRDKMLVLRGRELAKPEENIFWDYDRIENYFYLSYNYMNSDVFPLMHEKALEFNGKFLYGYPSAILSFIKQSKKYGLKKISIEGIILSSETVYPNELEFMKEYFDVDVLIQYGHTERNVTAYRMNYDKYHFMNSYGLSRIINNEIVSTTFDNFVMPFINYKTEDSISGEVKYFNSTDIAVEVDNIEGRTKDFLVTEDNRLVSITTMCGGQHLPVESMDAIQYVQNELGKVIVLVEGDHGLELDKLKQGMYKLVQSGIHFKVQQVDKIERNSRGKRVICKQALNLDEYRAKI